MPATTMADLADVTNTTRPATNGSRKARSRSRDGSTHSTVSNLSDASDATPGALLASMLSAQAPGCLFTSPAGRRFAPSEAPPSPARTPLAIDVQTPPSPPAVLSARRAAAPSTPGYESYDRRAEELKELLGWVESAIELTRRAAGDLEPAQTIEKVAELSDRVDALERSAARWRLLHGALGIGGLLMLWPRGRDTVARSARALAGAATAALRRR